MSFGEIVLWIVFGGLAGWIASIIVSKLAGPSAVGSNQRLGVIGNVVVGIIGAFVAGALLPHDGDQFDLGSFIAAIIGAVVLLIVVNVIVNAVNKNNRTL